MRHTSFAFAILLAACGGPQSQPPKQEAPDAAVAVAPPDAEPPYVPGPVPAMERSTDVAALRERLATTTDDREAILLHGQLATALYDASCAAPTEGLCVAETARSKKAPPTCGGRTADLKVVPRSQAVHEAEEAIGQIRQLWGGGSALAEVDDPPVRGDEPTRIANTWMTREVASSLILLGRMDVEAMYALPAPGGLSFDRKAAGLEQKSLERFVAWFTDVTKAAQLAMSQLQLAIDDPLIRAWAPDQVVEAMAWSATVSQRLVTMLLTYEVPKNIAKDKKATAAFCDMMARQAEPFRGSALKAWDACVVTAKDRGVAGPAYDVCYANLPP